MKNPYILKPCPFCGGQATVDVCVMPHSPTFYAVECNNINCPVKPATDYCKDKAFIIKKWNERATDKNGGVNQ